MIIDMTSLINRTESIIKISFNPKYSKEDLMVTELLELNDISVNGYIKRNAIDGYDIKLSINGIMILPCAITLKPVEYPFIVELDEDLEQLLEESSKKVTNSLDILPIVWENILMEIPMKIVSPEAEDIDNNPEILKSGNGWQLITEQKQDKEINSNYQALAKLKDLL